MKVTLFTSNNIRHNYLINLLSKICTEVWVIKESKPLVENLKISNNLPTIINDYFENVKKAENKFFGEIISDIKLDNVNSLSFSSGELNKQSLLDINEFLKSDIYIVFGSSYIKGELVNFLVSKKAINIHAGVSPYYRGTDCNFWALFDDNPHLVGSTIHLLSKGLDDGPVLYHAMSKIKRDPFEYSMSTLKSAFHSIAEKIKDKSIFEIKSIAQNRDNEIRYSKKIDFNEEIVKKYLKKKINLNSKKFDTSLLKEPFYLEK